MRVGTETKRKPQPQTFNLTPWNPAAQEGAALRGHRLDAAVSGPKMLRAPRGSPVTLLVAVLLLCVGRGPSSVRTQEQPDLTTVAPGPGLNLKFDPRTMNLSWNCLENATHARCSMVHRDNELIVTKPRSGCHCSFSILPLHGGVRLQVNVTVGRRTVTEELLFANPGAEGTAARNFSCFIYEADFMNCSWAVGPAAPRDVQYFLYMGDSRRRRERECPHYVQESGTHTGCHLHNLSGLPYQNFFLVNGTSQAMEIQFFDSILSMKEIERISPPENITLQCDLSHCVLCWEQPRTKTSMSYLDFLYQLDVQRANIEPGSRNPLIDVPGSQPNHYSFPSPQPRAAHSVKIRAADARRLQWSAWSRPVALNPEGPDRSLVHVHLLVVLGTLICALVLGFLLKRYHGMRTLFPPIPRVKDKVTQQEHAYQEVIWDDLGTAARKEDTEDILTVEEVS